MLAIDPRPGGATSNCAKDNIALLDLAVSRLPDRYRRRVLVRLDGAGFSHDLLDHIAAGGATRGRDWEFSVGWSCTDKEMDAIGRLPTGGIWFGAKLAGQPSGRAWDLAVALNARGGPGIVLATVTFQAGIINDSFFTSIVLLSVVTSQLAGFWLDRRFAAVVTDAVPARSVYGSAGRLDQEAIAPQETTLTDRE